MSRAPARRRRACVAEMTAPAAGRHKLIAVAPEQARPLTCIKMQTALWDHRELPDGLSVLRLCRGRAAQEYDRGSARLQASLLFLATIAILIPSAVTQADSAAMTAFTGQLSVGLSVLLIAVYGLGLLFSLKTHRDSFGGGQHAEAGEAPWPLGLALATLAGVTVLVALVSEVFVGVGAAGSSDVRDDPRICGFHRRGAGGRCGGDGLGVFRCAQEPAGSERGHRTGERISNRALRPQAGSSLASPSVRIWYR